MTDSIKKLEELREETAALIADRRPESLERARLLLNHQQLVIRQILLENQQYMELADKLNTEVKFQEANEKLQANAPDFE